MRRLISIVGLQIYACTLAFVQLQNGVRTDEAKYLLNIPYPHPPLARWLLGFFDGWQWQEHAARIVFATIMVQAVWLVWDMGRALRLPARLSLAVLWLGSAAFILQAGTVMMAPLTALQALLFLWMLSLPKERMPSTSTIGFLWLATLFTALQGVLLAPLVIAALRMRGTLWKQCAWYVGVPLVLVALYALGNPLVMANVLIQAGKDAGSTFIERGAGLLWILTLAGSGVGAIAGIAGLFIKKHWWILASFALFALYVFVGRFDYYAMIFLPFFITGAKHLYRRMPMLAVPTTVFSLVCTLLILMNHAPLLVVRSPARDTLKQLGSETILLKGFFGHEWQYEAGPGQVVRLYSVQLAPQADVIVCYDDCDDIEADGWVENLGGLAHTWRKG